MIAVVLALTSALLFGAMTVAIRLALARGGAEAGAAATILPALAILAVAAAVTRSNPFAAWPFLLAGIAAPGGSQLLFTLAVREAGASRTSVAVGSAPLVAVVGALIFLDEPLRLPLVVGALLVVAGGVLLAAERDRPGHVRPIGLAFAAGAMTLFALRDDLIRALHARSGPEAAACATMIAGSAVTLLWSRRVPSPRELSAFLPAGVLFGLSYLCLFEAYDRGRVSVVSPLVATESLWGVALSVVAFRATEGVGRRLALGALCVVAGGAVIGALR